MTCLLQDWGRSGWAGVAGSDNKHQARHTLAQQAM